ncbi:MAG: GNAT family N-acetyltransferase [Moraxellaceae bacterium]
MPFHLRHLQERDLPAVMRLQAQAYPDLAESPAAIRSRMERAAQWCWVAEAGDDICAYLLTHPWQDIQPPAWNEPLPRLPTHGSRFYIHDLALGHAARGSGLAKNLISTALTQAKRAGFHEARLIAVQNSVVFWQRQGFHAQSSNREMQVVLQSYGQDACLMQREL